jgi:uncharacterized protein (DUF58 family)
MKVTRAIAWGALAPLRLRARAIAEGIYAGAHRSARRGPGVEFGGQRPYVPGDDLRFLDRRALLRHDRLMVREFETETDRAVWLCVDATLSMAYKSDKAPGAKLAYAALLAAAVARVAMASGDPIGLAWLGGEGASDLAAMGGREAFDRVVGALESANAASDLSRDDAAIERALAPIARRAKRGAIVILFSDLLDLPATSSDAFGAIGTRGRAPIVVRVLDPAERTLPFDGTVRLKALEGGMIVEADADAVRSSYQARLEDQRATWAQAVERRGGRLIDVDTTMDPTEVVRRVVRAVGEARR